MTSSISYDCVKDPFRLLDWLMYEYLTFYMRSIKIFADFSRRSVSQHFILYTLAIYIYLSYLFKFRVAGFFFLMKTLSVLEIVFLSSDTWFSKEKGHLSGRYKLGNVINDLNNKNMTNP